MTDHVNHPAHYGGADNPYEAIKVIEAWGLPWHLGDAVKYIARHGKKDASKTVEDLKKARWYIDRYIALLERKTLDEALVGGIAMQDSIYEGVEKRLDDATKPRRWTLDDGHVFQSVEKGSEVCVFCDGFAGQHLNMPPRVKVMGQVEDLDMTSPAHPNSV